METIRNVYCVGRNYRLHAEELGNAVPTSPMIFSKPTHALAQANGDEISIIGSRGEVHYEAELVLHIGKAYTSGMAVDEAVDKMALGIDFTLRDVQTELKKKGHPWLPAKGFRNSAVLTSFVAFPGSGACKQADFCLLRNGQQAQRGNIQDMLFDFSTILSFIHENFGLGEGDIIYTGTPAGVAAVADGDRLALLWGENQLGDCIIRLT
ncbi:fumarylacetoacetate hydrolase family protein [Aneurinibacillus sp. Ricciae_BoGa-3]|uniref:fumarylacetoacetate hydrolase family protein n=1 Tax=Aneurinibacillus sp. Ricciae_BoGa-3 TaxID=3022697 RepID=UPI0023402D35|nr:fumarylacetoacetate hydrolase family protein [Aneurinibacillus sp. Ricciae_BoGa-3]WCK54971.1 fumarylacetoacetate hydrolase family protein [Aneurinibacillus sp. Ricciae_BoGa-3]